MPVSYEHPAQAPKPSNHERPASSEPGPPAGGGWRPSRAMILGAACLALLILTVIFALSQREDSGPKKREAPVKKSPAGSALPRGSVTFGEGGTEDLFGMPIKYPHTTDGAAAAALNEGAAGSSPLTTNEAAREALNNYIYTDAGRKKFAVSFVAAEKERHRAGLDENGQVVNDDGSVAADATYLSSTTIPEYGVYRVLPHATTNKVSIELWAPNVDGIARDGDMSDLDVTWATVRLAMEWDRGDWRIAGASAPAYQPDPASASTLNVSFAERASLFPARDGWVMVKNATQTTSAFPDGVAK